MVHYNHNSVLFDRWINDKQNPPINAMISLEQGTVCKPLFLQLFLFSVSLKSDYCVTPQSRPAIVLGEIKKKGGGTQMCHMAGRGEMRTGQLIQSSACRTQDCKRGLTYKTVFRVFPFFSILLSSASKPRALCMAA